MAGARRFSSVAHAHPLFDFRHLTPAQRVELAVALWESLPDDSVEPPLSEAQRAELMRRLVEYRRDPEAGAPWEEVRERIRRRRSSGPSGR